MIVDNQQNQQQKEDSFRSYLFNIFKNLFPENVSLCSRCKKKSIPYWVFFEIEKNIDLDVPYMEYRDELVKSFSKHLCSNCAQRYINAFDKKYGG